MVLNIRVCWIVRYGIQYHWVF